MSLFVTLEFRVKPDDVAGAEIVISRVLAQTRAFEGCEGVEVFHDQADETHWLVTEKWRDLEADAAYRAWRAGDGKSELGTILAGPTTLAHWHYTSV